MKLLTRHNPKLQKGEGHGIMSFVLHLAPSDLSGYQVCPMASAGCRAACLNTAGRGGIIRRGEDTNTIQAARIRKTRRFFEDRQGFLVELVADIRRAVRMAERAGMRPAIRLNGTSDIRWEAVPVAGFPNVMAMFPAVTFYDYTKLQNRRNLPPNYHLTFSRSEENERGALAAIREGRNVAVVFEALPATWAGRPVIRGDDTDLRFTDPAGVIVGLLAKGKARQDASGFVVRGRQPADLLVA